MALPEEEKLEQKNPDEIKLDDKKSSLNMKVIIIGIPVFILQLVIVYFVTANILVKKFQTQKTLQSSITEVKKADKTEDEPQVELGKFIYSIRDVIVNPANTDGKRLLLTNVGFDVGKEEMIEKLKNREALVKDAIISTLSSKNVAELNSITYRDTLKMEISGRLSKLVPDIKINRVYFSKYIIQ